MPRLFRATFADAVVVADVVAKRAGAGRVQSAASVRSAAKFEANRAVKYAVRPAVKHGVNRGGNAVTAATVRDAAGRTRDSSGRRLPLLPGATTSTDRPRDINRSCFLANRSRSTSARVWVRIRIKVRLC